MPSDLQSAPGGKVSLVGAGPGDPDLVTVRGRQLIESADVILYDNLATPALLSYAKADARCIYVGKKKASHEFTQQQINEMLVEHARQGLQVVRLKGGDPYIFGRGGEEAEALAEAGVAFEVVPGVTSAVGVAAYAGIPLTHRRETSSLTFVTGHAVDEIDWARVGTSGTLVIFMGLTTFGAIARRLIAAGRAPATPAAAVRWGTRGDQATVVGTLEDLAEKIREQCLKPPALVIVGEVVALRPTLNWFEKLPLFGRTVVVTRAAEQAGTLTEMLRHLGANAVELPTIEIRAPESWVPLDQALARLSEYDWLIFTSANGVRFFIERLDRSGRDIRDIRGRICAIGPATEERLKALHLKVDLMPEKYVAESVLDAFRSHELAGKKVLLPRAEIARDVIPKELERLGVTVDVVAAYRTVVPESSWARAAEIFESGRRPDWITFTSSSTATNFARLYPLDQLGATRIASIGPVTSKTIRELGLRVDVEADQYTVEGLVAAIVGASAVPAA